MRRLRRTLWRNPRVLVPSMAEADAVLSGRIFTLDVVLLDEKTKSIEVDSMTTVAEALQVLIAALRLENYDGYALYEEHNRIARSLGAHERLCDLVAKWSWLDIRACIRTHGARANAAAPSATTR